MKSLTRFCLFVLLALALVVPARAQLPEKYVVVPDGEEPPGEALSPAVLVGNTLYLSGVRGKRPDGTRPEAFEEELRQVFRNMRRVLLSVGMDLSDVISAYVFLDDMEEYEPLNDVFREFFPERPPVRSTMGAGRLLEGARVEVQAIAVQEGTPRVYYPVPEGWEDFTAWWPYTGAIEVDGVLYLAGLGTADMHTGRQAEIFKLQLRQSFVSLAELMASAGLDYRHVVFVNPYLTPIGDRRALDVVYRQFFEFGNTPARATLTMESIPGVHPFELTAIAVTDLSRRKVVRPISRSLSPTASPAVFAGNTLFLSAFSGFMPGYGYITEDFDVQVRLALRNVLDCLETAGLTLENVVNVNAYLGDLDDYDRMMTIYSEYFPEAPPALTALQPSPGGSENRPRIQFSAIAVRSVTASDAAPLGGEGLP